ncbi:MAG: two pore domain potassium channel family protein [Chlorobium sp.]|nr:two pore domain potassium channel family protein [Chlorobium sp.]
MKIFALLSPTWGLAYFLKNHLDRTKTIRTLNSFYLGISVLSIASIIIAQHLEKRLIVEGMYNSLPISLVILWSAFLISRNNEIFWAFLNDAFDKMKVKNIKKTKIYECKSASSLLTPKDRIVLSLKSYLELVFNFSIIYSLINKSLWKSELPLSITDFIYYSGITITTTGYGDITPLHPLSQLLSVYEVFCGVLLLVVCFAIYAGRLEDSACGCHDDISSSA